MRYIATIYTETGHAYVGPDEDLKAVIAEAKSIVANWKAEYESPVTQVYVSPFDEETSMPDSDADPLWGWNRESDLGKVVVVTKARRDKGTRRASQSKTETTLRVMRG